MKVRRIFYLIILCLFTNGLIAQNQQNLEVESDTSFTKSFFDNTFLKLEIGSQALFSENSDELDFKDRLTPSYTFGVGKWLWPVFGVGVTAQGGTLNGFSTLDGIYLDGNGEEILNDPVRDEVTINPDGTYRHFIRYANLSINVSWNATNLFAHKDERFFELVPSFGIGNMHVFNHKGIPAKNTLSFSCGIVGSFRLSSKLKLNTGINSAFFDNEFESRIAGDKEYENYLSLNLGLEYYPGFKASSK